MSELFLSAVSIAELLGQLLIWLVCIVRLGENLKGGTHMKGRVQQLMSCTKGADHRDGSAILSRWEVHVTKLVTRVIRLVARNASESEKYEIANYLHRVADHGILDVKGDCGHE